MNKVCNKLQRIGSFLLSVSLLIFGRTYLAAAHSQESVSTHRGLIRERSVALQPAMGSAKATVEMHSISHPFPTTIPAPMDLYDFAAFPSGRPYFPVAVAGKTAWYSAKVNYVQCSLFLPNVTWLGTGFGLKRLDNRARTVQHFCTLDGLPYNSITAVAGQDQSLYCSAEQITYRGDWHDPRSIAPTRSDVALCRYRADSAKWVVVAKESRPYPKSDHAAPSKTSQAKTTQFYYAGAHSHCVTVDDDHACLVLGPAAPGKTFVLISPVRGGNTEKILCPGFAQTPFGISFAHADRTSLWIGSELGLLRYDFKAHRWERLLSDLFVTGGCPVEAEGLWLLTQRLPTGLPSSNGHKAELGPCRITHFVQGKDPEHFPITAPENRRNFFDDFPSFTNIVAAGNRVWTTPEPTSTMLGNGQDPQFPAVYAFDLNTHKVTVVFGSAEPEYASVPQAVLANASTGWSVPVYGAMPAHFPGWRCAPDENDQIRPIKPGYSRYYGVEEGEEGWSTYGGSEGLFLVHNGKQHEERERYQCPTPAITYIHAVAVDQKSVWVAAERLIQKWRLLRFDRKAHTWHDIPLQEGVEVSPSERWISDGESCWMQTSQDTYRLDKKTDRWENVSARLGGEPGKIAIQQVVPDGEDVWLVAAPVAPRNVTPPRPPAIPLYRYHVETDTFVPVQPAPGASFLPHLLTFTQDSILLATSAGNFRFDRAIGRWQTLPMPALPSRLPHLQTLAIYEEAGEYWFVGQDDSLKIKK
jgi:hypothetical protein